MARGDAPLRVDVLGPVRVVDAAGRDITPDGALQRRLLALLVLRRGHAVRADVAVDVLWPDGLPRDPQASLQNHVSRLRRVLPGGALESSGDGYRLDATSVDVDADRLVAVVGAVPAEDGAARAEVDALLARRHGPAYPELADTEDGRVESMRLDELRVRAREWQAESRLALGDTDGLVADLVALVEAEPLRERPCALLMEALAATGRRVEALRAYDDLRRRLGDELGIEPSPAITARHAELLAAAAEPSAWQPPARLPAPTTSLVGRDALVDDIVALAREQRLVTLVGPGGVGKTRLLIEVGRQLRDDQPERAVVMSELAAAQPDTAVDAVGSALGIDARLGIALDVRLAEVIGDEELVLLLDNCEHVLEPVSRLAERLLTTCPAARVIATSRERLRIPGEHVATVPTLGVAGADAPAVALFLERARAVVADFEPTNSQREQIAEIARRLDGLPLAIELAAARLHTHDLDEIAAGLDQRFSLLASGYRTAPRHGSLGAAVSWSYDMLDDALRTTFADLSVFAGPFGVADAAAICGTDVATASDSLAQLVERSLVVRAVGRRYALLESLRAYGKERLAEAGRIDEVAQRHANHEVEWLARADAELVVPGRSALAEIDAALPELRAALDWMLSHDQIELAGSLVKDLLNYGFLRLRPDVLAWAERVAAADPDDASPMAIHVWVTGAYAAWMAGDLAETGVRCARAERLAERAPGPRPARLGSASASYALFVGDLADATRLFRWSVDQARASGDLPQQLLAGGAELLALGYAGDPEAGRLAEQFLAEHGTVETPFAAYAWYCAGEVMLGLDLELARARYTRALELAELTHASFITGLAGASRASIDARTGDPEAAAEDYGRLILHWRRAGMWSSQWTMLRSIAWLLPRLGRGRDAAVLEGAVRATAVGHRLFGADEVTLNELADQLRAALGSAPFEAARWEGAALDGDAAIEFALRALQVS